ncbi:MAG: SIR2 family protein [Pyrinomonadaceae bacterium]|nr:SIR2 family protein [Pyrinomonadaceae bacterium]
MSFVLQRNDVMLLLGAGASQEAGIPITIEMIEKIEALLENEWREFAPLYEYIKTQYQQLQNDPKAYLNIEDLVNTLDELLSLLRKEHTLSLFHLSWITFMEKVGNYSAEAVEKFRNEIVIKLKEWIALENTTKAKYYRKIALFQKDYNFPLRIFTLNYDKCIEETCKQFTEDSKRIECLIERGFGDEDNEELIWAWEKFSNREDDEREPDIYLYKMHGSIDWTRDEKQKLVHKTITHINKHEIIFGTRQKVKHYDPFLFFIYEFREYALKSKLIIVCGYGFWDDHINDIIKQGLESDSEKVLLVNVYSGTEKDSKKELKERLKLESDKQIKVIVGKASVFFSKDLDIVKLDKYFDKKDLPF